MVQPFPDGLIPFFSPRGVAVVGASQDPTKLGYGLARNLVFSGYQGAIYFVNPRGGNLFDRPVYERISAIPDPVDLVMLLIPAGTVPAALSACGERGIKAVAILAGGFRETGAEGAALELECLKIAQDFGIRLVGPNSVGLLDTHLPLNVTFLPLPGPLPGEVAFISHSGAICAAVIDWGRGQGIGFSRLVSLGNQADVNETDIISAAAADPFTKVLTLYLEEIRQGRRFVQAAGRASLEKPIIALKVGRSLSGQRAVISHTGALAGSEQALDAAFWRAGVIRASTTEEMFNWARALAWAPLPAGRGMAILTNAGGPGATAADCLEMHGLSLAEFNQETRRSLKSILPPAASLHNPVDMLASASPELYLNCLVLLLTDPGVDGVLVILPPPPMYAAEAVAKALIPVIQASSKPVVVALMGERLIQEAVEQFRAGRVPEYRFPERAVSALGVLATRAEYLKRLTQAEAPALRVSPEQHAAGLTILESYAGMLGRQVLPAWAAASLLQAYGIPVLPLELAHTSQEAVAAAERLGFPVALKIASPDIQHKSDVNGILLNLQDATQVSEGFDRLVARVQGLKPEARNEGVSVQRMVSGGQEVIIGAIQDPQFGALAMFGSGGTEVEAKKDIAFGLAPLPYSEATEMILSTWAGHKLSGFRHLPPADREAALDALIRLAQLADDFPQLVEIEINPLCVLPEGQGAWAVDVRVILSGDG